MAEPLKEYLQQMSQWRDEGLSLRAIADRLAEIGGPVVDPKTIAARLRKPVQSLEHISKQIRSLAVPIGTLQLDRRNARRHPENNLTAIKGSLQEFGQMKPIVANVRSGKPVVIAGNGTLEAALGLGWTHIAVITVNVSEATAAAFALADNRTAELAEWDAKTLAAILMELEQDDVDMSALGFDDEFVKGVLADANPPGDDPDPPDDDHAPIDKAAELQKVWQTARGQIWEIPSKSVPGRCHRVMCGDSLDPEVIAKVLDGQSPDGVWSDAPYGMKFDPTKDRGGPFGGVSKGGKVVKSIARPAVIGDDTTDTAEEVFSALHGLYPDALHLWWGANHYSTCLPASSCWVVWDKENTGDFADVELAWCSHDGAARLFRHMWNGMLKASERGEQRLHATQKPVALFEWCAQKFLPGAGKVWLDPFAGSGISLLGAERLGQIACCVELSEAYVAVILERAKNAGLEPRLIQ